MLTVDAAVTRLVETGTGPAVLELLRDSDETKQSRRASSAEVTLACSRRYDDAARLVALAEAAPLDARSHADPEPEVHPRILHGERQSVERPTAPRAPR